MTTRQATDEAVIRQRIDGLIDAVRDHDLDRVRRFFAPDVVSFDVQPPLAHRGVEAKDRNWREVFAAYRRPLGYEVHDLTVTVGGDVAFAHSLNRISGTLRDGTPAGTWVRWTGGFRRIDGEWLITHDQVSVPVDMVTGRALLDLAP
jgi:ketosteroid isomerase-like protein